MKRQKDDKLTDVERVEIKKYFLAKYTVYSVELDESQAYWKSIVENDYRLEEIRKLHELENRGKEWFSEKINPSLVLAGDTICRKDVYDKVRNWFRESGLDIEHGTTISKEQMRQLYLLTENMKNMNVKLSAFNENCKDKYCVDRVNAFFSNVICGSYRFKAGTLESIEKEKEEGKRQRSRQRVNGKIVDATPYTLICSNAINDYKIVKKQL
jgi:hypothetical protein